MVAKDLWDLFIDTGAPEMYLLYNMARKAEAADVFEDQRTGPSCIGIQ